MARSSYVYVVTKHGKLHSAYTVKHELEYNLPDDGDGIQVYRLRDNPAEEDLPKKITDEFYECTPD